APLGLRQKFYELIDREIGFARNGKPARIIAKINSLVDKEIIRKLYEASHAGVKIDLIVRGTCQLKPGIPGVSDTITVRSIVGRFLEHSRIFYFTNGGDARVWLSSADWMFRNLNERVELLFPVDDPAHVERLKTILDIFLQDNQKAYIMRNDGTYRRADKRAKAMSSQDECLRRARQASISGELPLEKKLKPVYRKD
ncbi:MAG TPA: RNA degradosome polyphosphate kinase, partial [Negativicutes bacterium]|nr:RNA degradosome polyphosphate kinase [Negativicutes bacterium]